jgi:hypothetical protein
MNPTPTEKIKIGGQMKAALFLGPEKMERSFDEEARQREISCCP